MSNTVTNDFLELRQRIDNTPMSAGQYFIIFLCFLLNVADGFDVLAMSYAAPALSEDWSVDGSALGIIFSAALAGMTTGAIFLSPLSDKFGRRKIILVSVAATSLSMLATTQANSITQLVVIRFFTGLGIGGILASAAAMTSEYTSVRFRSFAVIIVTCGFSLGNVIAGPIANHVIPSEGWQQLFLYGGLFTSALFFIALVLLPESIEFTARKPGFDKQRLDKVNHLLAFIKKEALQSLSAPDNKNKIKQGNIGGLFNDDYRKVTIQLWTILFAAYWSAYFLINWIPTLFVNAGLSKEQGIFALTMYTLGGLAGAFVTGYISTRINLTKLIAGQFFTSVLLLGLWVIFKPDALKLLNIIVLVTGFAFSGGFTGLYAVIAQNYPSEIRTTGVGWAIGFGRIGAILSPIVAGVLVDYAWSMYDLFLFIAIPPVILAACLIWKLPKPKW